MSSRIITESQKFTSDIVWVAISQVLIYLAGIIILSALTKVYTPEIYGVWVQVNVTVGLLSPILALHFGTAAVRFMAGEEDVSKRRQAFSTMLFPILTFALLMIIFSILFRHNLSVLLFTDPQYAFFIPLTLLWASMMALFSFSTSYLRARRKIKMMSVIRIVSSVVDMTLIVTLAIAEQNLEWIIVSIIAGKAAFIVTVLSMIIRDVGLPKPNLTGLGGYLAFSVPQIPSAILLWVISASDRYFITHFLNLSQSGNYSASYILGSIPSSFLIPISLVLFPTLSKFWEQNKPLKVRNYLEYSTKLYLVIAIPAAAGLYILSQPLLQVITTSEYMAGSRLVLLVGLGAIFAGIYQINLYIILLVQQTKWLPLITGIAAATNIGINIALIPEIGIIGAAVSTIVSYFVLAIIVIVWARKAINYRIDFTFLIKVIIVTIVMVFCLRFMPTAHVWNIILAIITGVAIFALGLILVKAFSKEDRRLIREAFSGLNPRLWNGKIVDE